jgi:uncharacterized protein YhaN
MSRVNEASVMKKRLIETNREINKMMHTLSDRDAKYVITQAAYNKFVQAADFIKESYTGGLSKAIGKVLYQLTGLYDEIIITSDYEFYLVDSQNNKKISVDQLSRGLLDQLYFAVRVGLMDTVNRNDKTPLVLDDSFVHYDDDRLMNVLKFIYKLKRQVIILTCQKREEQMLTDLGIAFSSVNL